MCHVTEFYGARAAKKEKHPRSGRVWQKEPLRTGCTNPGRDKEPRKKTERESCIKGHEHDSDMHDICENIASAHWWDRWDTEAVFFLTFDYQSVAIFHRAGNFSGRQRAGGTLGPLQRGREGWRDERRKCLCNLLLILLTQHKTLNDLLKSLHMKNVSFWIKSCNVTVLESELSWI